MDNININRKELLKKIYFNRNNHEVEYNKALTAYRVEAIKQLKAMLNDAENNRTFARTINLPVPYSYIKDYDRGIAMLEMSVDDVIKLDAGSFDQYVMDNWSWKPTFGTTNSFYFGDK